jgi:hypothetical protein
MNFNVGPYQFSEISEELQQEFHVQGWDTIRPIYHSRTYCTIVVHKEGVHVYIPDGDESIWYECKCEIKHHTDFSNYSLLFRIMCRFFDKSSLFFSENIDSLLLSFGFENLGYC